MRQDVNLLRTQVAQATNVLSTSFNGIFAAMIIAPGKYVAEMTTPEQSTGAGALATQKIRLVPREQGFPVLVVGEANKSENRAELRSFAAVDQAHRERYERGVPLHGGEYSAFLAKARSFFDKQDMIVTLVLPDNNGGPAPVEGAPPKSSAVTGFVLGTVVATIIAVTVWYLRNK